MGKASTVLEIQTCSFVRTTVTHLGRYPSSSLIDISLSENWGITFAFFFEIFIFSLTWDTAPPVYSALLLLAAYNLLPSFIRGKFFTVRVVRCWTAAQRGCGCPVHPWRCSRLGWMGPWAAWSSIKSGGWWPCLWQGGWSWWSLRSLSTQAILTSMHLPENPNKA